MIKDIYDLCIHLNTTVDSIVRDIYDSTECGAWIFWDDKAVTIGTIVEGSDAEFSNTLDFPFHENAFDSWVELLEEMANEAWHEANDDLGGAI